MGDAKRRGTERFEPRDFRMLVDGQLRSAVGGTTFDAVDPVTREPLGTVPAASASDVDAAVYAAGDAFSDWRDTPPLERAALLRRTADVVEEHGDELAMLDTLDNGSPLREMRKDVDIGISQLNYFAGLVLEVAGKVVPTPPGTLDFTLREPFGVVARIVAFNHPVLFATSRIAAPLVVGNTVVLKPSEHTSLSALRLGELLVDVFPAGVLNIVTGTGDVAGDRLVTHPKVRRVGFTGSAYTGRLLQQRAAEHTVKSLSLELGGKNPLLVFPDADIGAAVEGAVRGMNFSWVQGQSCGSTSRLYVHRSLFDVLTERLAERMDAMQQGDPLDERTETGAIAFPAHYERIMRYIEEARNDDRVRLLAGGGPPKNLPEGVFIRPTLFACEDDNVTIVKEEIFGPVLVALPFDSYDEVIRRANDTEYGLTASVWTTSLETAMNAARELEAGYVWINDSGPHVPGTPFGGHKASGFGREEDIEELLGYTQLKNIFARL